MIGNGSVMNEWKLREQMCEIGRRIYAKGFAAANDGNISYRLSEDRVLCSPTRVSKGYLKPDDLCIVDLDGHQVSGKRKRSSEILLHLTIMKARADVRSVVHCHPPHATAFAVAREPVPKCILPEIEVFLGEIAISPYETPGSQSFADTVLPYVKDTDTILLANHGTVTYGSDLEDAYFKTEIIDAYCRILILAKQIGRVNYYTDEKAAELIKLKAEAGHPGSSVTSAGWKTATCAATAFSARAMGSRARSLGYSFTPRSPAVFKDVSPIESVLTPLASDMAKAATAGASTPGSSVMGGPSANGRVATAAEEEALVQTITDQVMRALNGTAR